MNIVWQSEPKKSTWKMRIYRGTRTSGETQVLVDHEELPLRTDLANHSPTGFEWGYGGSGPAQLALAILAYDVNDEIALAHYEQFKTEVVAKFKRDGFLLTSFDIREFLESRQGAQ